MKRSLFGKLVMRTLVATVAIGAVAFFTFGPPEPVMAQEEAAEQKEVYDAETARKLTYVNPHEQISDEGNIIWESCLVCHTNLPDIKTEKTIEDTQLRFKEDLDMLCRRCHVVKAHPEAEGVGIAMMQLEPPDHLVVPTRDIVLNIRLSKKDVNIELPRDPATGRIICVTCHNPHERGLVRGRNDTGADGFARLRTPGLDICQYCHRK